MESGLDGRSKRLGGGGAGTLLSEKELRRRKDQHKTLSEQVGGPYQFRKKGGEKSITARLADGRLPRKGEEKEAIRKGIGPTDLTKKKRREA